MQKIFVLYVFEPLCQILFFVSLSGVIITREKYFCKYRQCERSFKIVSLGILARILEIITSPQIIFNF